VVVVVEKVVIVVDPLIVVPLTVAVISSEIATEGAV
jgi:hypothetical protein